MSFNAYTMAYITDKYRHNSLSIWQQLIHHIEDAAYQGYDYYTLTPRESQYIHKLGEYGFEVIYNEVSQHYIARWDV